MSLLFHNNWKKIEEDDEKSFKPLFNKLFSELCNNIFQFTTDRFNSAGCGGIFTLSSWFKKTSNQVINIILNVSVSTERIQIYSALEKIREGHFDSS
jgi:hypothetical protein